MKSKPQATLVLIKPDGLKKSLTGNILTRLSETKLEIVAAKVARVSRRLAEKHYQHLKDTGMTGDGFTLSVLVRNNLISREEALAKEEAVKRDLEEECRKVEQELEV